MHTTKVQTTACSTQGWPCWAQQKGHQYSHRLMSVPGRAEACVLVQEDRRWRSPAFRWMYKEGADSVLPSL